MASLQHKHIASLQHAIRVFESGLEEKKEAKYHKGMERDIKNLIEARDILLEIYRFPSLPFVEVKAVPDAPVLNPITEEPDESS